MALYFKSLLVSRGQPEFYRLQVARKRVHVAGDFRIEGPGANIESMACSRQRRLVRQDRRFVRVRAMRSQLYARVYGRIC